MEGGPAVPVGYYARLKAIDLGLKALAIGRAPRAFRSYLLGIAWPLGWVECESRLGPFALLGAHAQGIPMATLGWTKAEPLMPASRAFQRTAGNPARNFLRE